MSVKKDRKAHKNLGAEPKPNPLFFCVLCVSFAACRAVGLRRAQSSRLAKEGYFQNSVFRTNGLLPNYQQPLLDLITWIRPPPATQTPSLRREGPIHPPPPPANA